MKRVIQRSRKWLLCLAGLVLLVGGTLAGCSPSYVARAAYEETQFLWRRKSIEKVLADSELKPAERAKLEMVQEARRFAEAEAGLKVGGSFATLSKVDGKSVVNVLAAAKHDRLERFTWWFPVVGKVPYKGFFDKKEAEEAAESLKGKGYDTYVRPALAFSSLGWFDDPLPSVLLARDTVTLAQVVFHELFHRTVFVTGEMAFNESAANFAGDRAAIEFFCAAGSKRSQECREAKDDWQDMLMVSRFLDVALNGLRGFYETSMDLDTLEKGREREFAAIRERFKSLDLHDAHYANFTAGTLNNASLLEAQIYLQDLDLFDELYRNQGSVRESVLALKKAVGGGGDPFDRLHEALVAGRVKVAGVGSVGRQ